MSILVNTYSKPSKDKDLIIEGLPLWLACYGWLQYVKVMHEKEPNFLDSYIVGIQCPALEPSPMIGTGYWCIPIDNEFREGKMPYDTYLTSSAKGKWYPNVYSQVKILNEFVKCGPYIPKYQEEKNSTWELNCTYQFVFKWGGPEISDPDINDPATAGHYRVPDTLSAAVQIRDPAKQKSQALLHSWDLRRGIITQRALKRMSENIETDTTFQPDTGPQPYKKKKITGPALQNPEEETQEIQSCLLSLCEEDTCQDPQGPTKPPQAHQPAARATAAAQVQHLKTYYTFKRETTDATTSNRTIRMTTFKPGFEQDTEEELARAFKRPVRKFKEDTPFYPWLPPTPIVNFNLNYKF